MSKNKLLHFAKTDEQKKSSSSLFVRNVSLIPPGLFTVQQARAKNKVWRIEANWQKKQDKGNEETGELWKKQNKQKMKRTWHL